MKKSTFLINAALILVIVVLFIGFRQPENNSSDVITKPSNVTNGNKASELINSAKQTGTFKEYSLFNHVPKDASSKVFTEFVRDGVSLNLNKSSLQNFIKSNPQN